MSALRSRRRPMRIAFFVHRFPVISEAFIMNAAIGLLRAGHEVDIYALHGPPSDKMRHGSLAKYANRWRCKTFTLRERPRQRIALAPLATAKLLATHGRRAARAWDARRFGTEGSSLVALHEASTFLRRGRYDILHCQFGTLADSVLNHRDAGFLSGRVIVHFRGYDISSHVQARGPAAYRGVFARADGFFTNCSFFARRLEQLGAPADRVTIVPSPIDLDLFRHRARHFSQRETLRVLCVGRLVEKKGFGFGLDAIAGLTRDGVDVSCQIIGDGPLRQSLQARAVELGIGGRVEFTGAAAHEQIAAALDRAHIFLAPSVTASNGDQDASINTLKEAMATGCPFVTTTHGGIPEMAEGLDAGVMAPEGDAGALHIALRTLLDKREHWPEMGKRARAHIERSFSIQSTTGRAIAAYEEALSRAPPQTRGLVLA